MPNRAGAPCNLSTAIDRAKATASVSLTAGAARPWFPVPIRPVQSDDMGGGGGESLGGWEGAAVNPQ